MIGTRPANLGRLVAGLTTKGWPVALTYCLRQAVETLSPTEAAALLGELRELISTFAPRSPRSAA
jgi:hypothetical protein